MGNNESKKFSPTQAVQQRLLDQLKNLPSIYSKYGIEGVNKYAEALNNEWKKQRVLIAVIGRTGCGKSTLINRARGLNPDDPTAARTKPGASECTVESKEYHVAGTNIIYVDLPGTGTNKFPFHDDKSRKLYCDEYNLGQYDYYLLVAKDRFQRDDFNLASYIKHTLKKNFSLVYTYTDVERSKFPPGIRDTDKSFAQIKEQLQKGLHDGCQNEIPDRIFLISNKTIYAKETGNFLKYDDDPDYDFDDLIKNMTDGFKLEERKQTAFLMSLNCVCDYAIKRKAIYLRTQACLWAVASGGLGVIPIPGTSLLCDTAIVLSQVVYYNHSFGTDGRLTARLLLENGTQTQKLVHLIRELTIIAGFRVGTVVVAQIAEEAVKLVPIIGSIVGASVSFTSTLYILQSLISVFENEALQVLRTLREQ